MGILLIIHHSLLCISHVLSVMAFVFDKVKTSEGAGELVAISFWRCHCNGIKSHVVQPIVMNHH